MRLSNAINEKLHLEREFHGPVVMSPRNRRQLNFVAETNSRLFDTISSQRLLMDAHADAFLRSLQDAVSYDKSIYSGPLQNDEERFLDRMFSDSFDRRYITALWYSKIMGDLETTLCNTVPLTYPSTVYFASHSQIDALRDSFDRGAIMWDEDDQNIIVRHVENVYTFLRLLDYGMQCIQ